MKWVSGWVALLMVGLSAGCSKGPVAEQVKSPTQAVPVILSQELVDGALNGELETINLALADGLNVNAQDEGQRTLLMFAAFNGQADVIKALLKAGADVNHKDATDRTALMFASTGSNVETVQLLLKAGAKVNAVDNHENWTALMMAAAEGQTEVINVLLANGADVTMKDTDGEDSAYFARQRGFEALAQTLENLAKAK